MIDIYLDCADLNAMREAVKNPLVKGVTTNPSLMRAAGVTDYERFAKQALEIVNGLPISFEVFSDKWDEMERQARKIASWGKNVNVKIPITNTKRESAAPLVRKLSDSGILCNVTGVFTKEQVDEIMYTMNRNDPVIISVFVGRMADSGFVPDSSLGAACFRWPEKVRFLWASTREVLNIYQAQVTGWDIITVSPELLKKYEQLKGKDLTEYSLETVTQFYNDAQKAGYTL